MKTPFHIPAIVGKEKEYLEQVLKSRRFSGDGLFTKKCSQLMEKKFEAKKVLLTTSCTSALEMAAILCQVEPGNEVILPSYTFASTATAFYMRGARLVFVDIRSDTLNIDENKIEKAITKHTKVIVPVHYAGVSCEMDKIIEIAKHYHLCVVEDAAQAVNAKYKNKYLGTIGTFGTYSFHESKNYICGEGGALVINDKKFIERAEIIREKGTDRSRFFRGEVDKYTWLDVGSSYLPSELLAAFLYGQLEQMDKISERRKKIFEYYYQSLTSLADENLLELPNIPSDCQSNYHLFHIVLKNKKTRNDLMDYLKSKEISTVFHYLPLHLSPMGRSMDYKTGQLPITESISSRLLRLPFYYDLKRREQAEVVKNIYRFFANKKRLRC